MIFTLDESLRQRLSDNLEGFEIQTLAGDGLRSAAVALVVTSDPEGVPAILLTLRPVRMGRHSNQYALPGGKVDPGETATQAAFRELSEELGIDLPQSALLGQLDDYPTRSGFRITPFVLWAGAGVTITPEPTEVAEVHYIPFAELDSDAIPLFAPGETEDRPVLYSNFPALGTQMYSPTASIIYQFREAALHGRRTRVSHFDQPRFAWR
ncbi:MAG: CoA pyrophosphatase [Pseudomonadota bacterium]